MVVGEKLKEELKPRRGFACLTPEQRSDIARQGGIAAHKKGTGHEWTSEEASRAGRKGGIASRGGRGKARPQTPADFQL